MDEVKKRPYNHGCNREKWVEPLKDYMLETLKTDEERAAFAVRCGTTLGNMHQMMYGNRGIKEEYAIAMDRESDGVLSIFIIRPDVDWKHVAKAARRVSAKSKQALTVVAV